LRIGNWRAATLKEKENKRKKTERARCIAKRRSGSVEGTKQRILGFLDGTPSKGGRGSVSLKSASQTRSGPGADEKVIIRVSPLESGLLNKESKREREGKGSIFKRKEKRTAHLVVTSKLRILGRGKDYTVRMQSAKKFEKPALRG